MNRIVIAFGSATAACAAAVPAVLGLSGNPSFSQHIPIPVPSHAKIVQFDDRGRIADDPLPASPSPSPSTSRREPGDDGRRVSREPEPGDDNGGLRTSDEPEPGDDNGGDRTRSGDSGDDGQTSGSDDDHGGHGGGGDDG